MEQHLGVIAASGLAIVVATGLVIVAHRQTAAATTRGFAICRGEVLQTAQRNVRLLAWLALAAVVTGAGMTQHAVARERALATRVGALEAALAQAQVAPTVVAAAPAPVPPAPATPAPVVPEPVVARAPAAPRSRPEPAAATPPAPARVIPVAIVRANGKLLLRDAPAGAVLGAVSDGTSVVLLGEKMTLADGRSWTHVRATGRTKGQIQGWAASEFIAESTAVAQN